MKGNTDFAFALQEIYLFLTNCQRIPYSYLEVDDRVKHESNAMFAGKTKLHCSYNVDGAKGVLMDFIRACPTRAFTSGWSRLNFLVAMVFLMALTPPAQVQALLAPRQGAMLRATRSAVSQADIAASSRVIELQFVSKLDGDFQALAVRGPFVYVGEGLHFTIIDTGNPLQPRRIGRVALPREPVDIEVVDDLAYVLVAESGLYIVDVHDPTAPAVLGTYPLTNPADSLQVVDYLAYAVDYERGLQIIDVRDPTAPIFRGHYDPPGRATAAVQVLDNLAYLADGEAGLLVLDVTDPTSPTVLGNAQPSLSHPVGMWVAGNFAYASVYRDDRSYLDVFDISDPTQLRLRASAATIGNVADMQVVGDLAFVANVSAQVLDVSNPYSPTLIGSYRPRTSAVQIAVVGDLVYVAANEPDTDGNGLYVLRSVPTRYTLWLPFVRQ